MNLFDITLLISLLLLLEFAHTVSQYSENKCEGAVSSLLLKSLGDCSP
jgi:hypothetical protein